VPDRRAKRKESILAAQKERREGKKGEMSENQPYSSLKALAWFDGRPRQYIARQKGRKKRGKSGCL